MPSELDDRPLDRCCLLLGGGGGGSIDWRRESCFVRSKRAWLVAPDGWRRAKLTRRLDLAVELAYTYLLIQIRISMEAIL